MFLRNRRRAGPVPGTGDHRVEAKDAGEASPAKPGWGKELKNKRFWVRLYPNPRAPYPTYNGGNTRNENNSASHPHASAARRSGTRLTPGDILRNSETDKR